MEEWQVREAALIGEERVERLKDCSVLIFGVGGVGGYVTEACCRAGIGRITVVDHDTVAPSNLNRQLIADTETIGRKKAELAVERIRRINPDCRAEARDVFADETNISSLIAEAEPDYIIDAIDTVTAKLEIIRQAKQYAIPVISSMGTGNKLRPERFHITDISKTSVCPLARVMRKKLRDMHISGVTVLYSDEEPVRTGSRTPASVSYVPAVGGLLIAGYVIRSLIGME